MKKFTEHTEAWGKFVDVKINSADVLQKQIQKAKPDSVFMSSACDGWQQIERKYRLSRKCLSMLLEHGFSVSILTKNANIRDDFDIIQGADVKLGFTLTAMDDGLCRQIEPRASLTSERIRAIKEAEKKGIRTWAFLGPFMPFLSDSEENLDALFGAVSELNLENILVDHLNPKSGIWQSIKGFLGENYPYLIGFYGKMLYDNSERKIYSDGLRKLIERKADKYRLTNKLNVIF